MQFSGLILNKMILHMRVKFVENFLKMMTIHMLATAFYNSMENDMYILIYRGNFHSIDKCLYYCDSNHYDVILDTTKTIVASMLLMCKTVV